jgi:hypothetical protein
MKDEQKNIPGFISPPKTIQDFEDKVRFQFENVAGWMSVSNYELTLLKAKCLVEALEELIEAQSSPSKQQ